MAIKNSRRDQIPIEYTTILLKAHRCDKNYYHYYYYCPTADKLLRMQNKERVSKNRARIEVITDKKDCARRPHK